jgi:hypothetical protein
MNIDADFLDMLELPLAVYLNEKGLHRAQAVRVVVLPQEQEVRTYDMAPVRLFKAVETGLFLFSSEGQLPTLYSLVWIQCKNWQIYVE